VHTFPAHAHLQALFQAAKLALVPMMLIDRTVSAAATRVREVPPDAPLEEALASWKKEKRRVNRRESCSDPLYSFQITRV